MARMTQITIRSGRNGAFITTLKRICSRIQTRLWSCWTAAATRLNPTMMVDRAAGHGSSGKHTRMARITSWLARSIAAIPAATGLRWNAKPGRRRAHAHPLCQTKPACRHCEERPHPLSLRGAQRRGNLMGSTPSPHPSCATSSRLPRCARNDRGGSAPHARPLSRRERGAESNIDGQDGQDWGRIGIATSAALLAMTD